MQLKTEVLKWWSDQFGLKATKSHPTKSVLFQEQQLQFILSLPFWGSQAWFQNECRSFKISGKIVWQKGTFFIPINFIHGHTSVFWICIILFCFRSGKRIKKHYYWIGQRTCPAAITLFVTTLHYTVEVASFTTTIVWGCRSSPALASHKKMAISEAKGGSERFPVCPAHLTFSHADYNTEQIKLRLTTTSRAAPPF